MLLLAGGVTFAQKGEKGGRDRMKDLSPEQVATLKTKKATLALDLSKAQQAQMKAYILENAKIRKVKMEERKAQKESAEAKKPTSEERYARANERLDYQIAQKAKLAEILSDEQMEKWGQLQHRKGKHRKGKGHKGKGRKNKSEK